jgi:hypothetical protein
MFAFNCYSCGARLGDFPTIDALDDTQASVVGFEATFDQERVLKSQTLDDTQFAGMSAGSFCTFCLMVLDKFPHVTKLGDFSLHLEMAPDRVDKNAWANRHMMIHLLLGPYKLVEELESYLTLGIEYVQYTCAYPGCDEELCWNYPDRWKNFTCHKHNYDMTALSGYYGETVYNRYLVAFMDHDFMECARTDGPYESRCEPCWDLYLDHIEDMHEAYQEQMLFDRYDDYNNKENN